MVKDILRGVGKLSDFVEIKRTVTSTQTNASSAKSHCVTASLLHSIRGLVIEDSQNSSEETRQRLSSLLNVVAMTSLKER
jgi:hypothetical protein